MKGKTFTAIVLVGLYVGVLFTMLFLVSDSDRPEKQVAFRKCEAALWIEGLKRDSKKTDFERAIVGNVNREIVHGYEFEGAIYYMRSSIPGKWRYTCSAAYTNDTWTVETKEKK